MISRGFRLTSSPQETLLFLSQQYHSAWRATAHNRLLRAVRVNNFYQGVIVPSFTDEIELSFRPFVIWSWIAQLLFLATAAALLLRALLHTMRYSRRSYSPDGGLADSKTE